MTRRISIETSFQWTQRFVAREWGLVLPLVLAFLLLPPLVVEALLPPEIARIIAMPRIEDMPKMMAAMGWLLPLSLIRLLLAGVGTLALFALALRPRVSVGEAIAVAARRLPVLVGAMALLLGGLVVTTAVATVLIQFARLGSAQGQQLLLVVLFVAMMGVVVRLSLLGPVIVERRVGPIDAFATSWRLGQGNFWRMVGTLALYMVGGFVVLLALNTAVGAVLLLIGRLVGAPDIGRVLAAIFFNLASAVLNGGATLLVASFYRQLAEPSRGI